MSGKLSGTVLVVDDDTWLVDEWTRHLKGAGYDVVHASHAIAAIECLDTHKIDVIVLDMFMPGPNGLVLLHELRSHDDLANIPVIVCTNAAESLTLDQLRPYGVCILLDKTTMDSSDLVASVRGAFV